MSISQLQSFVNHVNIADELDEEMLSAIANRVKRQYDEDLDSMTDWKESVSNGIDLMKQEWNPKSTPWEGASNYKDPLLSEASTSFGNKAYLELLRSKDLVSTEIIGKDPDGQKKDRGSRVSTFENYQINHEIEDWRSEQKRLFYFNPNVGCTFKKLVYDPIEEKTESHLIQFPDFVVNQATKSMSKCRSFSQVMDFSANDVEVKVRSGRWLDIDDGEESKESDKRGDKGSNEAADVTESIDNPDMYIEQQCFFDIDEDGYEEPYIITVHHKSSKVVRIVARYDEESIIVDLDDVVMPLPRALELRKEQEKQEFGGDEGLALLNLPDEITDTDPDKLELLKIIPFQNVVKYGFIPAPDGTFLDYGYSHLLGAITQAINSTTNQLSDAGTIANLGGGFLSKEFRKSMGAVRLRINEWLKTEVPADKFAKGLFPNPAKEPSQVLFQLNENLKVRGRGFLAVTDLAEQISANTAPTTALTIIQEAMVPTSALFKSILDSEGEEFRILFRINQRTLDDEKYSQILGEQASVRTDFNSLDMVVSTTANAEMSTKMQRIQVAQIELAQFPLVLQAGGNPLPILQNFFEAIGSTIIDRVFPEEGTMNPQEQQQLEQLKQAQEQANQMQQLQLQILEREQTRLDQDSAEDRRKTAKEIEKLNADITKVLMDAALSGERAESEALKNQLTKYTGSVSVLLDSLTKIGDINDRQITQSPALQPIPNLLGPVPRMEARSGNGSLI